MRLFGKIKASAWTTDERHRRSAFSSRPKAGPKESVVPTERAASSKRRPTRPTKKDAVAKSDLRTKSSIKKKKSGSKQNLKVSHPNEYAHLKQSDLALGLGKKGILKEPAANPIDIAVDVGGIAMSKRVSCVRFNEDVTVFEIDSVKPCSISYSSNDEASLEDTSVSSMESVDSDDDEDKWSLLRQFEDTLLENLFICKSNPGFVQYKEAKDAYQEGTEIYDLPNAERRPSHTLIEALLSCKGDISAGHSCSPMSEHGDHIVRKHKFPVSVLDGAYLCKPSDPDYDESVDSLSLHTEADNAEMQDRKDKMRQFREILARARLRYFKEYRQEKKHRFSMKEVLNCSASRYQPCDEIKNSDLSCTMRAPEEIVTFLEDSLPIHDSPDDEILMDLHLKSSMVKLKNRKIELSSGSESYKIKSSKGEHMAVQNRSAIFNKGCSSDQNVARSTDRNDSYPTIIASRAKLPYKCKPMDHLPVLRNSPAVIPLTAQYFTNHRDEESKIEYYLDSDIDLPDKGPPGQILLPQTCLLLHTHAYEF